jgi:hypothetical protein
MATIEHCGSNIVYPGTKDVLWCDEAVGHEGRHWHKNVSWPKGNRHGTTKKKPSVAVSEETDFLTEMEMRSAHASFCSQGKGTGEPWLGWSFQRRNYSPVLFCLRMLYGFQEARAEDLYE